MRTRGAVLGGGVAVVVAAMLLAGCTSGDADEKTGKSGASGESGSAKAVPTPGGVLVEQTIDTPDRDGKGPFGGTLTVTVRSVVVTEAVTQLSWALRWDNPDVPDDAWFDTDYVFNTDGPPTLTEGSAMKLYLPLCRDRDWRNSVDSVSCSIGGDGSYKNGSTLVNHKTTEAWAVFPRLEKGATAVDLTLPAGLPAFAALPVTWA